MDISKIIEQIQVMNLSNSGIVLQSLIDVNTKKRNEIDDDDYLIQKYSATSENPKRVLELFREMSNTFLNEPVTKYQDPHEYIKLRMIEERIRKSISDIGYSLPLKPVIASITTSEVNAHAYSFPGLNEKILLFRSGILKYYSELVRTVMSISKWEKKPDGNYLIIPDQNYAVSLAETETTIFTKMYKTLDRIITNDIQLFKDESNKYFKDYMFNLFAPIRSSIWTFIVGHEYGHILNGDLDDETKSGNEEITFKGRKISTSHSQEYFADVKGFELMNVHLVEEMGAYFTNTLTGTCLFFSGIDLLYRTIGDVLEIDFPSEYKTHPNPIDRWNFIQSAVYQNSEDKEFTIKALNTASRYADLVEVIYAFNSKLVKHLKADKDLIEAIWVNK